MRILTTGMLVIAVAAAVVVRVKADDKKKSPELDPQALEKLFAEFAKPGEAHESFKQMVGKWDTESKNYMVDMENPSVTQGTATFRLLMGGRYLQQDLRGEYEGQKFEGMGISGFDNATKKYVGICIDNYGTGIMHSEGEFDPETDTMTEIAETSSPLGKMRMKMVAKHINDDKFTFSMYLLGPDDEEQKHMVITYTRAKKKSE